MRAARAMASATRVACNKEGDGNSNKGNGKEGGGQAAATRAMAKMWAMGTAMRLECGKDDIGKGSKANSDGNVRLASEEEDGG